MDIKTELVTLAVRVLSSKTSLVPQPDPWTELFTTLFGGKSYEQRVAEDIVKSSEQLVGALKKANTNRKFKKIIKNG